MTTPKRPNGREKNRPRQDDVTRLLADGHLWQVREIAIALGLTNQRARAIVFDMRAAKRIHYLPISRSVALYGTNPDTIRAMQNLLAPPEAVRPPEPERPPEFTGKRATSVFDWGRV